MRPTPLSIHPAYQNAKYAISHLKGITFSSAYAGKPYEYKTSGWRIVDTFIGYYLPEQMNNEDGYRVVPRTV
jgi:hypothetical protein